MAEPAWPPSPWRMHGDAWGSLFLVRGARERPDGWYAVGWVRYDEPSPLTYHELLVGRVLRDRPGRPLVITDIWVDSVASRDGGRALWAIPKDLCDFTVERSHWGPVRRDAWHAAGPDGPIASARFRHLALPVPAVPFSGGTRQPSLSGDGAEVSATLTGRGRSLPAKASWWFAPDGPLGWLHGQRRLASFRLADFSMTFH